MKVFVSAVLATLAFAATPASASEAAVAPISSVFGAWNGAVLFTTSGARTATPACQGPGLGQRWALDASATAGQAQLSVFMTAYALRKRVTVIGSGVCSIWGDTETVAFFVVED